MNTDLGNREELAWAAGFYDGEGGVYIKTTNGHRSGSWWSMSIGQKDLRPLVRFQKAIMSRDKIISRKNNAADYYVLQIQSKGEVTRVMNLLWPYLTEPKKEQFNLCQHRYETDHPKLIGTIFVGELECAST
jgi:hypothetical protein